MRMKVHCPEYVRSKEVIRLIRAGQASTRVDWWGMVIMKCEAERAVVYGDLQ